MDNSIYKICIMFMDQVVTTTLETNCGDALNKISTISIFNDIWRSQDDGSAQFDNDTKIETYYYCLDYLNKNG